ncbi:ABC transporter permease [Flammeovirga kamogawensis]|uniref:FtsX-like permease family protein n=1 Tax=Flammeovirga kamogawensis TaxID=373891 RepID=A0ABX8H1U0_9BACT|nr:FtsX-like permease family protein [Flammeovirga kamogawensis]MBB6464054.1 ABC-type lipoprotein release transport system permease subunit [Flammeovirga kamogawensis]QWG09868.1 FtsX-like permease family protein [Flammeovirga kamogawensis]TRX65374.1 FtsX-like permease family protein [Flammeovirga kamogawensis]
MNTLYHFTLSFKLAFRNIISSGLRTWLTIITLALAFVMILFFNSMYKGWEYQGIIDQEDWEFAQGHLTHPEYDKLDPFTIESGHGTFEDNPHAIPVLIIQANIYPEGRMLPILLKGIPSDQQIVKLPTHKFKHSEAEIPVIIGEGMAQNNHLKVGDKILMRWKDNKGTFDAKNVTIEAIFKTSVPTVDAGQIWIDINTLWSLTGKKQEATYFLCDADFDQSKTGDWKFSSKDELLKDFYAMIEMKSSSSVFLYGILMIIALIAIFDSQVFSVFKRQKEIGTYIALGFTKKRVTFLFTVEGVMYALLAIIVGTVIALPLISWLNTVGIPMSANQEASKEMGVTIGEYIYPLLTTGLYLKTVLWIIGLSAIVSYLPVRKIAKMNTVDALKGKK